MAESAVLDSVHAYLRELRKNGIEAPFVVLFGSHATGHADEGSDIDLIVVSPRFDGVVARDSINLLWRVAARTDARIEPIPCGVRQWEEDDATPIIAIGRREGRRIAA